MHPDIQSDPTQRRHHIQFTPTLQNPQIQAAPTQHRMPLRREPRRQLLLQRLHEWQRAIDRIVTPLRLRAMRRAPGHRDPHAQHAFRSSDHLQIRRLQRHRKIRAKTCLHQRLRAQTPLLFPRRRRDYPADIRRPPLRRFQPRTDRREHRRRRSLRIARSPPVQPPAFLGELKRGHRHPAHAHRVEMRRKHHRRPRLPPRRKHPHHTRPPRRNQRDLHVRPERPQMSRHPRRHRRFPRHRPHRVRLRMHTRQRDQFAQDFFRIGGGRTHRSPQPTHALVLRSRHFSTTTQLLHLRARPAPRARATFSPFSFVRFLFTPSRHPPPSSFYLYVLLRIFP